MPDIHIEFLSTRPASQPAPASLPVRLPSLRASLRELIARTVREQSQRLAVQQTVAAQDAAVRVARQYLTDDEVEALAREGRVAVEGGAQAQPASGDDALQVDVQAAWQAFERQRFMVTVGDRRVHTLDEMLDIGLGDVVRFVRLMPLQGG
jgi:hypothetical protein